ncbi:MAG: TolC family protein [Ginsengibacter sp.]
MKRYLCLFGIMCSIGFAANAQTAPSLKELIDSAIIRNYELANKMLEIQDTEIDQKKLKDAYLPHVSITGKEAFMLSSFNVKTPEILIPQLNIDIKEGHNRYTATGNLMTASAGAEMLVYSGGKVPALKKALEEKKNAQIALLEKDRQEIRATIHQAYDQMALFVQMKALLVESEKRLAANKATANKALGYGLITKYEHQKIEVAQSKLESKNLEYEGKRSLVLKQLYLLTNIDPARLELIDHTLEPTFVNINEGTIENRAEIKALEASILANKFKMQSEKKWFVPKVQAATSLGYVGLSGGHLNSSKPVLPGGSKKLSTNMPALNIFPMFNIGIGFKWDIFDGNAGKHAVQKAALDVQKSENSKKSALEKLELNQANAQTNYNIANAQIALKEKQKKIAQDALTQATNEYRLGLITSSQLIDAENDYQNAAMEYVQSVFDQRRAADELLQATGSLE